MSYYQNILLIPIIELEPIDEWFESINNEIYMSDMIDSPVIFNKPDIDIVILTITFETSINIFDYSEIINDNIKIMFHNEEANHIQKNSKSVVISDYDYLLNAKIFTNGKIMVYAKEINFLKSIQKVIDSLKESYPNKGLSNFTYSNISVNAILKFSIPFQIDYDKIMEYFQKNDIFFSNKMKTKILVQNHKDCHIHGFFFYLNCSEFSDFSFTIFYTGKIQARGFGNQSVLQELKKYCNHVYEGLIQIKNYIILENKEKYKRKTKRTKIPSSTCSR